MSRRALGVLGLLLCILAAPVMGQALTDDFDDGAKTPDPNNSVYVFWPSIDEMDRGDPPSIQTLTDQPTNFGPNVSPGDNMGPVFEADPNDPGRDKIYVAESQEGLSGSDVPGQIQNFANAVPQKFRIYTFQPPIPPDFISDDDELVTEFTPPGGSLTTAELQKEVIVEYEWTVRNRAADPNDLRGTFEFPSTLAAIRRADELQTLPDGRQMSDPDALGSNAWLPFGAPDSGSALNAGPGVPFPSSRPLKGVLTNDNRTVPPFSYTAPTPGDFDIGFKITKRRNDGNGNPVDEAAGEKQKHLEVANLTPPMMLTGKAPGPVFSTTGDRLDDEDGSRTPEFWQDDPWTVIWVMHNAHSGTPVTNDSAPWVEKIEVNYPSFDVDDPDDPKLSVMPGITHNIKVDPVTGEVVGDRIYNGGDTFGLGTGGTFQSEVAGTPVLETQASREANLDDLGVSGDYVGLIAEASKAGTMQEFADGSYSNEDLTRQIIEGTKGKGEGHVATIQLPPNFPMPECQMAMLSVFKVKVPIDRAPVNIEGKIPWTVRASTSEGPAGALDGSLAVVDNKPPDVAVSVSSPREGWTKVLAVQNTGGAEKTLGVEPFSVRLGDYEYGDINPFDTGSDTTVNPEQQQEAFPEEAKLANIEADKVIQLPENRDQLKAAVAETLQIDDGAIPAKEDERLAVVLFVRDNVSTWEELYLEIYPEGAGAEPTFKGSMRDFKNQYGNRFFSNARQRTELEASKLKVSVFDFDPSVVPYRGPSKNPRYEGKNTLRLLANRRDVIIPVNRGGVSLQLREMQRESSRGDM